MNVQYLVRKLFYEPGRKQPHVSRKADEIDFVLLQRGYHFAVVIFTLLAFRWNDQCLKSTRTGLTSFPTAPEATFLAMASKLEPRPESRMLKFFIFLPAEQPKTLRVDQSN